MKKPPMAWPANWQAHPDLKLLRRRFAEIVEQQRVANERLMLDLARMIGPAPRHVDHDDDPRSGR